MVIFAAFLAAVAPTPQAAASASGARAQATASIRIVQAERLRFAKIEEQDPQRLRLSKARLADGSLETLRIIEFE
jgi:hypothetical protein